MDETGTNNLLVYSWTECVTGTASGCFAESTIRIKIAPVERPLRMKIKHFLRGLRSGWLLYTIFGQPEDRNGIAVRCRAAFNLARQEWRHGIPDIYCPGDDNL